MPDIVFGAIEEYVTQLVPPRDAVLSDVEHDAEVNHVPIVGPLEGQLLSVVARIGGVRSILEVGTATGYSAIWLARAAKEFGGTFVGIELDPSRHGIAVQNLERAGLGGSAKVILGNALEVVPTLGTEFDMVFLDLVRAIEDPTQLNRLYQACVDRLRVGGILAVDNVLHGGEVVSPTTASAKAAAELNQVIAQDKRLDSIFLTMRDGVALARKSRP